ncbi:MAG: hypothetical protein WCJ29_02595 [bacterium]
MLGNGLFLGFALIAAAPQPIRSACHNDVQTLVDYIEVEGQENRNPEGALVSKSWAIGTAAFYAYYSKPHVPSAIIFVDREVALVDTNANGTADRSVRPDPQIVNESDGLAKQLELATIPIESVIFAAKADAKTNPSKTAVIDIIRDGETATDMRIVDFLTGKVRTVPVTKIPQLASEFQSGYCRVVQDMTSHLRYQAVRGAPKPKK